MTNIVGINVVDGSNNPFDGILRVNAVEAITSGNTQVIPLAGEVIVSDGSFTLALPASENKVYEFTFIQEVEELDEDDNIFIVEDEIYSFRAGIPDVETVMFSDLFEQTGISAGSFDSSVLAITRKLYNDGLFWQSLGDNLLSSRGVFEYGSYYKRGDLVTFDGSSYRCIATEPIIGIAPTDEETWVLFVAKGDTGTGTDGNPESYDVNSWSAADDAPSRSAISELVEDLPTRLGLTGYAPQENALLTSPRVANPPEVTDNSDAVATTDFVQDLIATIRNSLCPVGSMVDYAGATAPTGWILCDGRLLNKTQYPALFAVIGTLYNTGGEHVDLFRVPDLRGRSTLSPDSSSLTGSANTVTSASLAARLGVNNKTLSTAEMPKHYHNMSGAISWTDGIDTIPNTEFMQGLTLNNTGAGDAGVHYRVNTLPVDNLNNPNLTSFATPFIQEYRGNNQPFSLLHPVVVVNKIIYAG